MCRILTLQSDAPFDPTLWVRAFAERCQASKEYQGDGWGVTWLGPEGWSHYRSLLPIWDDEAPGNVRSTLVLVHARSAFRNEGLVIENNMPFLSGDLAFAFNGELRGVRLAAPGATGAWRLLHLLDRFRASEGGDVLRALRRLDDVVTTRTEYVRAMNLVVSDGREVWVNAHYSEDPDYFTLHAADVTADQGGALRVLSSERFSLPDRAWAWHAIPNGSTFAFTGVTPSGSFGEQITTDPITSQLTDSEGLRR
jgi:glutamine amidotransferase